MRHGEGRKRGDATGRPSWKSSLLGAPERKFFCRKAAWSENRPALGSGRPFVEFALRCALNAPPFGLRRGFATDKLNEQLNSKTEKGDISILVRRGTFLFCFDTSTTTN